MNKHDLIRKHGFRPGTSEDFMAFAGAPADALFKYRDFETDPASGCVCTYSESEGSCHFYIFIKDGAADFGKIFHGPDRLIALACAASFDEWFALAEDAAGDEFLRLTGHDWEKEMKAAGFNRV